MTDTFTTIGLGICAAFPLCIVYVVAQWLFLRRKVRRGDIHIDYPLLQAMWRRVSRLVSGRPRITTARAGRQRRNQA
jgi:hypothetical protein